MACSRVAALAQKCLSNCDRSSARSSQFYHPDTVHTTQTHKRTIASRSINTRRNGAPIRSLHSSCRSLARPKKSTSTASDTAELGELVEELTPQPKPRRASSKAKKLPMEEKLKEIEELKSSTSADTFDSTPLRMYGGGSAKKSSRPRAGESAREKMLRQFSDLDDGVWESVVGLIRRFSDRNAVLGRSGVRSTSQGTKTKLTKLMGDIQTTLHEYIGNTAGGVNAKVNLKALEEALATDLEPKHLEEARASRSASLYDVVQESMKDMVESAKSRMAPLKPQVRDIPAWESEALITSGGRRTNTASDTFLEYEQPLTPWDSDPNGMMPDLDSALVVTPVKKSHPYKFVLVALDSNANEDSIRQAIAESVEGKTVNIIDVEIFNDLVANKQRRHAFVSVQNQEQLNLILDDRIRAFGVHINGQRSTIADVEEKNIISLVTRPPMDSSRIEAILKELGVMDVIRASNNGKAPAEPTISSMHLHQHNNKNNRFSIFSPRDGNGDLIGKAWLTFPTHDAAYAAYHSLVACRPGAIRAFWSQKSPNHFEEAIRLRDALAAENAELRQRMLNLTQTNNEDEPAPQDEMSLDHVMSAHIRKVLSTTRGDLAQAAQLLNITERTLQGHVKKFRSSGLEIPVVETRGKSRLTSSRE